MGLTNQQHTVLIKIRQFLDHSVYQLQWRAIYKTTHYNLPHITLKTAKAFIDRILINDAYTEEQGKKINEYLNLIKRIKYGTQSKSN